MKNKKGLIIAIVSILCLVLIVSYFALFKSNKTNNKNLNTKVKLTTNYSMFFTVSGCINTYYSYVGKLDGENVIKLLNSDYIKNNKINKNNVFDKITSYENNIVTFKAKKMYEAMLNSKITIYYVYGDVYLTTVQGDKKTEDAYLEVRIDNSNRLFDITPINKDFYEEVINGQN